MPFTTELKVKPTDGNKWELLESLEYKVPDDETFYIVPSGFVTGLASIPRIFRVLYSIHGKHTRAAVLHDWFYATNGHDLTRKFCDNIFYDAMLELDVRKSKAWVIYKAVRMFGWLYWKK